VAGLYTYSSQVCVTGTKPFLNHLLQHFLGKIGLIVLKERGKMSVNHQPLQIQSQMQSQLGACSAQHHEKARISNSAYLSAGPPKKETWPFHILDVALVDAVVHRERMKGFSGHQLLH
jgi:hypothetical protein